LTPVDKEGAQEVFNYGLTVGGNGVLVGEDGNHVVLQAPLVNWGTAAADGQSPYFFTRETDGDWQVKTAANQPEMGVNKPIAELFSGDLTRFAFSSSYGTSAVNKSKEIEYETGPPGGPYATVASVPKQEQEASGLGWVGASRDLSRLFLSVHDSTLLGGSTGTKSGADLYEYYENELRQVNVTSAGVTIGSCGASLVQGGEGFQGAGAVSSAHAVSSDGSRVFFEAIPSSSCSEAKHLYMRVGGESTVDLGAVRFLAANAEGSEVLFEKRSGEAHEIVLYDTESGVSKVLFVVHRETGFKVAEDLSAVYFISQERLTPEAPNIDEGSAGTQSIYRYDIPAEKLSFLDVVDSNASLGQISPDGRYLYFQAEAVEGVPGGQHEAEHEGRAVQVYRYDSAESLVQCMSCASPFDPEPKLISVFGETGGGGGMLEPRTGFPRSDFASANGDYVFFDTPSRLLPADVDGEVTPEYKSQGSENSSNFFSVSSDVYEWRKPGIDGCVHVQGCLALITNGRGGFLNLFLGTDESGQDAFIYTNSQLVPQDDDTAGDIYDARIDGGEPPSPPRAVECEGDACATPTTPPNDTTPASFTFSGIGNLVPLTTQALSTKPKPKAVKNKPKKKSKKKPRHRRKAKKADHERGE
jgi:hypothetical protein